MSFFELIRSLKKQKGSTNGSSSLPPSFFGYLLRYCSRSWREPRRSHGRKMMWGHGSVSIFEILHVSVNICSCQIVVYGSHRVKDEYSVNVYEYWCIEANSNPRWSFAVAGGIAARNPSPIFQLLYHFTVAREKSPLAHKYLHITRGF